MPPAMVIAADAGRLAVGTLTAIPVPAPRTVDRRVTAAAMVVAPLAVTPVAAAVVLTGLAGHSVGLPAAATAIAMIAVLALGTRNLHLDGLSDTVDGLASSFDAERSLQVMRSGVAGPAGVVALIVTLGLQAAALTALSATSASSIAIVGAAVLYSRSVLATCCVRGVPAARPDGLGATCAGSVPRWAAATSWGLSASVLAAVSALAGRPWWLGVLAAGIGQVVVVGLLARCRSRLGGVTGDVFGAAVELSFTASLLALSAGTAL